MRLVHGRGDVGSEWTRWGRTEGVVAVGAAPELPRGDVARRDVRLSPHRAHRECTIATALTRSLRNRRVSVTPEGTSLLVSLDRPPSTLPARRVQVGTMNRQPHVRSGVSGTSRDVSGR